MNKVTHTAIPTIEVIENLRFNIEVRDKLLKGKDKLLEEKDTKISELGAENRALEARIKAMKSPKVIDDPEDIKRFNEYQSFVEENEGSIDVVKELRDWNHGQIETVETETG